MQTPARKKLVLIVDDHRDLREFTAELLQAEGYSTAAVANGAEALDYMRSVKPSVILLDLMMPQMDGASFRERQLMEPELARIPVVIMTALRVDGALPHGLARCVLKPFQINEVIQELEAATAS